MRGVWAQACFLGFFLFALCARPALKQQKTVHYPFNEEKIYNNEKRMHSTAWKMEKQILCD